MAEILITTTEYAVIDILSYIASVCNRPKLIDRGNEGASYVLELISNNASLIVFAVDFLPVHAELNATFRKLSQWLHKHMWKSKPAL